MDEAPVGLHNGSRANPVLEPDYELGALDRQRFEIAEVLEPDEFEGYFSEDLDVDGVLDQGEDTNRNGVLDVGIVINDGGELDEDEIFALNSRPIVYKAEAEIDATFDDLFDSPEIAAVHRSAEAYDVIVACGELTRVGDTEDDDEVLVALRPVGGSGFYGYAVFERDTGNVPVFGENTTGVTVYLFKGLSTLRGERAAEAVGTATATP